METQQPADEAEASSARRLSVPPLQPRSLERDVYEILCGHIAGGQLLPGDPLVEGRLSAELGVSKTPVREALIRLQRDGLVEIVPYRGARVASLSVDDVRSVCELRRWIEVPIARRLAEQRPAELITELTRNVELALQALDDGNFERYVAAVRSFSDLLVARAGNVHAADVLDRVRNKLALIANASRTTPGRWRRSIEEHRAICAALAAGDAEAAERATTRHIASIESDCLRALSETAVAAGAAEK